MEACGCSALLDADVGQTGQTGLLPSLGVRMFSLPHVLFSHLKRPKTLLSGILRCRTVESDARAVRVGGADVGRRISNDP